MINCQKCPCRNSDYEQGSECNLIHDCCALTLKTFPDPIGTIYCIEEEKCPLLKIKLKDGTTFVPEIIWIPKCNSCEFLHKNCHFINDEEILPECFDTMKQIQEEDAKPLLDWGDDEEDNDNS
jgi:hypothetical protein